MTSEAGHDETGGPPRRRLSGRRARAAGAIFLVLISVYQTLVLTDVTSDVIRKGIEADDYEMIWTDVAWVGAILYSIFGSMALAGRFGSRVPLVAGMAFFALGNLLCGAAVDLASMIFAKVIDGIGKGMTISVARASLYKQFDGAVILAIGFYGVIAYATRPLTPLVTSYLNDWLSWRWIFWINVPVALLGMVAVLRFIESDRPPEHKEQRKAKPSRPWTGLLGLSTFVGWVVCLLFVFKWYRKWGGWTSPNFDALAVLAVVIPIVLAAWFGSGVSLNEQLQRTLRSRVYVLAMMTRLLLLLNLGAIPAIGGIYMLELRGYPRSVAGWVMAPAAVTMAAATLLTTVFQRRSLRHVWGMAGVIGTSATLWWLSTLDNYTPKGEVAWMFACWGFFIGLFPPVFLTDEWEGVNVKDKLYSGALAIVGMIVPLLIVPTLTSTIIKAWADRASDVYRANLSPNRPAVADSAARIADHFARRGLIGDDLEQQTATVLGTFVQGESVVVGLQQGLQVFSLIFLTLGLAVMIPLWRSARTLHTPPGGGYS